MNRLLGKPADVQLAWFEGIPGMCWYWVAGSVIPPGFKRRSGNLSALATGTSTRDKTHWIPAFAGMTSLSCNTNTLREYRFEIVLSGPSLLY